LIALPTFFKTFEIGLTLYPFGSGLGVGQPFGSAGGVSIRALENEQGRILMEVGLPGLFGVFAIRVMVISAFGSRLVGYRDSRGPAFLSASLVMITASFLVNLAFNHTSSSMTWCVVALAFWSDASSSTSAADPVRGAR